jgi:hypothetical protein
MAMEFFYPEEIFYLEEMQSGCFVCVLLFPMQYVLIQRVLAVFDIAQVPLNICNAKKRGEHLVNSLQLQVSRRAFRLTSFISTTSNFCN